MGSDVDHPVKDNVDEVLVMYFYTNAYDIKGIYPIKVKVWGKTLKFDACTLNTFLKTRVNLQPMPGNDAFLTPYD